MGDLDRVAFYDGTILTRQRLKYFWPKLLLAHGVSKRGEHLDKVDRPAHERVIHRAQKSNARWRGQLPLLTLRRPSASDPLRTSDAECGLVLNREMLTILLSAGALQVAAIPPALPQDPGPERRSAAAALFDPDPIASETNWGLRIAASMFAGEVLSERNANAYDRDARLSERFIARVKAVPGPVIDQAIRCVAEPLAQSLYVADLDALGRFARSPDGRPFWRHYVQAQPWQACFALPVRRHLEPYVEEDLEAVIAETPLR